MLGVYGEDAESDGTCEKWVAKIHAGDFSCAVAPRVGRPGAGRAIQGRR